MNFIKTDYDAVVVGSGPNGLSAAITLQRAGLSVLLLEGKDQVGGGLRSSSLIDPLFVHDVCSAIHPMATASPFFRSIPLEKFGLEFIHPVIPAAHPLDNGSAAALYRSVEQTAENFGEDQDAYLRLINPLLKNWPQVMDESLAPLHFPKHPLAFSRFGLQAISSAKQLVKRFHSREARGLWAGMAAHSMLPLSNATTSAVGLVLMLTAHSYGWPMAKGGSGSIAKALADFFISLGGKIETNFYVHSINQLPSANAILFDVTPKQLLQIAGEKFSALYAKQLKQYRYGVGVFKIDWTLDEPIPFQAEVCRKAGTVHIGNTFEEIAASEQMTAEGKHPEQPFVLLAQQSLFDSSRAPVGKHTAWAYCHVPNGSTLDMTERIEKQIERFAPGFRDIITGKHLMNAIQMEEYNPNYVGGDINGGSMDIRQLFTRPVLKLSPYRTSAKGIYICSSSTPPGGGVHGMCGYHAAQRVLKDMFKINDH